MAKLLSVKVVAARLAVSRDHVYDLIQRGALPAIRIGSRRGFRVAEQDLLSFEASRRLVDQLNAKR